MRRDGGWFGGAGRAPAVPRDAGVLTEADLSRYVASLERNGFFGPDSWYMNHARNIAYARTAPDDGRLSMPVLFLHGAYDYTCETIDSRLAEPMRGPCADLTEVVVRVRTLDGAGKSRRRQRRAGALPGSEVAVGVGPGSAVAHCHPDRAGPICPI